MNINPIGPRPSDLRAGAELAAESARVDSPRAEKVPDVRGDQDILVDLRAPDQEGPLSEEQVREARERIYSERFDTDEVRRHVAEAILARHPELLVIEI